MNITIVPDSSISTEDKIKNAAWEVFLEKGYEGATTRDIAQRVGMNRGLMSYYFRNKETLFDVIFEEQLQLFYETMKTVLATNKSLKEKIIDLVNAEFTTLLEKPKLVSFINQGIKRNPSQYTKLIAQSIDQPMAIFAKQLDEAIQAGLVKPIDVYQLLTLIYSPIRMIFMEKPTLMTLRGMDEDAFLLYARDLKQTSIGIILAGLFLKEM